MADFDLASLDQLAKEHGIDAAAVQKYAADHGISLESAAAALGINIPKLVENAKKTIDKCKAVAEDVGLGAGIGGAIGTALFPGVGTAIGGVVGTVAGAAYGVISEFGGDIVDFVSSIGDWFSGPTPVCLDFFRQPGSCDNIDRRMNNVASMQRDIRAHRELAALTPEQCATRWDVELKYAFNLLLLERVRIKQMSEVEASADMILHARPDVILGQAPLFGSWFRSRDDIVKLLRVSPEYADQMLSAAPKLLKPKPPPRPRTTAEKAKLTTSAVVQLAPQKLTAAQIHQLQLGGTISTAQNPTLGPVAIPEDPIVYVDRPAFDVAPAVAQLPHPATPIAPARPNAVIAGALTDTDKQTIAYYVLRWTGKVWRAA